MWTKDKWMIAVAVLLTAVAACDDDDDDGNGGTEPDTEFEAILSGSEEEPVVVTPASGSATVSIQGSAIAYQVNVENIENVVVSHIHIGAPGENGPVIMNLCNTDDTPDCSTTGTGVLVEGSNSITMEVTFDSLVSAIRAGNAYVNVHTSDGDATPDEGPGDFPGGEIRGQLTPQ
jgi:CHRD domain